MTMRLALLVAALVAVSCGSTVEAPTPTAVPSAPSRPVAAPSPTPSASPTPRVAPFPDLTYIVGTSTGDLYFQIKDGQPAGRKVHVCAGAVRNLTASGRQAAFFCGGSSINDPQVLYVYDDVTGSLTPVAKTQVSYAALTTTNGVAYVNIGSAVGSAPIPTTKLLLYDLRDGTTTTIDERFGVALDMWSTTSGVAIWRPQNSSSFRRSPVDSGTWLLQGRSLVRLSLHRLVAGYEGRYLLESEPTDPSGYGSSYILLRTDSETRLTPADVVTEQGVEVLPDGRTFAWRPQGRSFDGTMVVYRDGVVVRQDPGKFSTFGLLHTADPITHAAEWVIGMEISGPPSFTFHAYRLSDGAFATIPAGSITSLALLGPKN